MLDLALNSFPQISAGLAAEERVRCHHWVCECHTLPSLAYYALQVNTEKNNLSHHVNAWTVTGVI